MSPWKVILATVIIFAAGVMTGAFVVHKVQRPERPGFPPPHARPPQELMPTPWFARREFLDRMDHHLNLDKEQHDRIAKILQASQERTRAIVRRVNPEIQEELHHVRRQILAELTPEQAKKFDELQHLLRRPQRPPIETTDRRPPPRRDAPMKGRPETNIP